MVGFPLSFLRLLSSLKLAYFSLFVNFYYVFLRCLGARFWGGLVRGFGTVWCAVLTFFMFFVSGSHDFAFVLDPEFIFSVQTIQTSYSFCPKSPYYPLKPNSSQNFMVRNEISFFEPNPSVNSHGLNRVFFSLDQKPHILSQNPTQAFSHISSQNHTQAFSHILSQPPTQAFSHSTPPQNPTKPPQVLSHHQKTAPESNVSGAGSILYFTIYLAFAASMNA